MKIIIGAIVFGLVVISIIVMLVINFTYRSIKKRREEMEDDYYQHFGKDYFKSAAPKKQQTTKQNKPKAEKPKVEKPKEEAHKQEEKETARRTMTTDSNVRIYDEREASDKRKIFDDKEGEYVEFEEV